MIINLTTPLANLSALDNSSQLLGNQTTTQPTEIFAVFIMAALVFLSFHGNLWIVIVILITPQLRASMANIFVINLCCVDLVASVTAMPMSAVTFVLGEDGLGPAACEASGFLNTCVMVSSVLSLSVISIERYYTISLPMHHAGHATPCLYLITVTGVWVTSLVAAMFPLLGVNSYRYRPSRRMCSFYLQAENTGDKAFVAIIFLVSFLIPTVILLTMYAGIFRVAKKAATVISPSQSGPSCDPVTRVNMDDRIFAITHAQNNHGNPLPRETPRVNVQDVSANGSEAILNNQIYFRRLSIEDSGIRTAEITDTMSANSCNNNDNDEERKPTKGRLDIDKANKLKLNCAGRKADSYHTSRTAGREQTSSSALNITSAHIPLHNQPHTSKTRPSHSKAFKTLMIIVVSYVILWGPYFACLLHDFTCGRSASQVLELLTTWLSFASYAVNPVLYGCMNRMIREELFRLWNSFWNFCCCCQCLCCSSRGEAWIVFQIPCRRKHADTSETPEVIVGGEDELPGGAESFYQFLQRTQASDVTNSPPVRNGSKMTSLELGSLPRQNGHV
ncbi:G-protein coupled receptor 61-like [Physella acuta]|uniref:G-protein coupled receptor 61-like n=1 Tax=Physella acuta TaxID=109671 RepID=UPI0027DB1740|nr:G-protein coupled receptor 61-like [Physella acuta]